MDDFSFDSPQGLDPVTQAGELQRRRALLDALQQRSMSAPIVGPNGGIQAALKVIESAINGNASKNIAKEEMANRAAYQTKLGQEASQYIDTRNGRPGEQPASINGETPVGPPTEGIKADPRQAVIRAMTSQLPEMQAVGKADFGSLIKMPEVKEHVIGNQLIRSRGVGAPEVAGTYNKADWVDEPKLINGQQVSGQRNQQTGEWKASGPAGQTINIDNKGMSEVQKETIPVMKAARETVVTAQNNLQSAERVMKLVDDPAVQTGFGASSLNGFAAMGTALGFQGPEAVAKTQALASEMAAKTLSLTKQLTGAISDKEKPFLEQVANGKIDFTPQVIKHTAALSYQAAHNQMMLATDQYREAKTVPGMEGAEKLFPLPPVSWNQPQANGRDDPALQLDRNGRMQYDGSYLMGSTPNRRASDSRRAPTVSNW